jgi:hypothetical protein
MDAEVFPASISATLPATTPAAAMELWFVRRTVVPASEERAAVPRPRPALSGIVGGPTP